MTPTQYTRSARLLLALALIAITAGAGCKGRRSEVAPTPNERTAEAFKLSLRGQEAQKAGKADQAIDLYRRALELQPNMRGTWNNLGVLLMKKHAYLDAISALKHEADLSPDDPRPCTNIGVAYLEAGYAEESLRYHLMALDRDPNWVEAIRGVALASRRLNKADEKIAEILKRGLLLEQDPAWRSVLETERMRVEAMLKEQQENSRSRNNGSRPRT
jgi:tetratricopeptide (TPR) repeat protein